MIDVSAEKLLTLSQAAALFPDRPSVATLWRWRTKGCKGRKLESIAIGGKVYVTLASIQKFAEQRGGDSGEVALSAATSPRTLAARERAIDQAEKELAKAGI